MHDPSTLPDRVARVTTDFGRNVYCVLGLPFDALTLDALVERVRRARRQDGTRFVSTPNVNFVIGSRRSAALRDSVLRSDLSMLDGMPLLWIARFLGIPIPERAAGSDLFDRLRRSATVPLSVFFFGGNDGLTCRGYHAPGHGSIDEMSAPETIASINASGADFLVVALGALKGQTWIVRNLGDLRVPVVCHLGAVINFLAGNVRRAPKVMQSSGLEWLWRIKEEPGLWRRYAGDGMILTSLVMTRVLPAWTGLRWRRLARRRREAPRVSLIREQADSRLSMAGDWTVRDVEPLRRALADVTALRTTIVLDLAAVKSLDSATIALLLLLKGHQIKIGERLKVDAISTVAARQLYLMGAEHLHDPA